MRKQYFIKVFFVYLGFISSSAFSDDFPFEVGERLEYIAKFNFIPAGKAFLNVVSIDTINTQPAFHVQYEARTGPIADRLYKIRDYVDSWLDEKEFFTWNSHRSPRFYRTSDKCILLPSLPVTMDRWHLSFPRRGATGGKPQNRTDSL